jgi:hypothetical protein
MLDRGRLSAAIKPETRRHERHESGGKRGFAE